MTSGTCVSERDFKFLHLSHCEVILCIRILVPKREGTEAFVARVLLNTIIGHLPHLSLIEINDTIFFL